MRGLFIGFHSVGVRVLIPSLGDRPGAGPEGVMGEGVATMKG